MTTKNLDTLNIRFTNKEADNNSIWAASLVWHNMSTAEVADRLDVDFDCAAAIKCFLTEVAAVAEGVNVEFWFD